MGKIERQIWPVVVAHRGDSARHPENTLEAFEAAVGTGADVVELDVRLTADGIPVVLHDGELSRTTDGSGFVHEVSLAELKRLDASRGRGPRAEVPTLVEALELLSGRAGVNVEIKNLPGDPSFDSPREEAAEKSVRALEETSFRGEVIMSSFNWLSIERVREMEPEVPTGFLTTAAIDPWATLVYVRSRGHAWALPQAAAVFDAGETFVQEAHAKGVRVGTWTVDDEPSLERLFGYGVDAVATNDPVAAVPIRDRVREEGPDRFRLGSGQDR